MKRFLLLCLFVSTLLVFSSPRAAYADNVGLIMRGVARTLVSAFEIPREMMMNAGKAFPLGLIGGVVSGAVKTVAGTLMGVTDIARGAAPYAKYAVFAL